MRTRRRVVAELLAEQLDDDGRRPRDCACSTSAPATAWSARSWPSSASGTIVGVDIIEEAAEAAERDRPGVYDDYVVVDLTDRRADDPRDALGARGFNCLTTVAALGFGDIPPEAFATAFNLVEPTAAWVAFNIKERFLTRRRPERLRAPDWTAWTTARGSSRRSAATATAWPPRATRCTTWRWWRASAPT